jgi:hypothetical protein
VIAKQKAKAKIIDAKKEKWYSSDDEVIWGICIEHSARPDLLNRFIHTSAIVKIEGNVVETLNTIYEVEWADDTNPAA